MAKIRFGTDGWRAVISENFTFENVKIVAQAIADYVKNQKSKIKNQKSQVFNKKYALVVGYDTRFLSEKYAELVSCVLAANGIEVLLCDRPSPTPAVSFNIRERGFLGGVMVTASHNPACYNGIKYKGYFGGSVGNDITDAIESKLYKSKVRFVDKDIAIKRGYIRIENVIPLYLKFVEKYAHLGLLRKTQFKILVDSMNGVAARYIEGLLNKTNNRITTINYHRDPYFGGRSPEPNEALLKDTAIMVKKKRFDLGFATDGDADRLGVILPNGKVLSGHKVMTLLLLHLFEERGMKGGVVQTICGTALIDKICKTYGLKIYETPVGFKYISDIMTREDILIGGEETGGIALKGWLPERDGIMAALLILEMLACRKRSLQKILDDIDRTYGTYIYRRHDLYYTPDKRKKLIRALEKSPFRKILGKGIVDIKSFDGFKFIRSDGSWLMVRASGTEPKLRIYSEAHTDREARRLIEFGKRFALHI